MAGRTRTLALLLAVLLLAAPGRRAEAGALDAFSRLRPLDDRARALLRDALSASFTVQQLAERVEASDIVAYVRVAILGGELGGATVLQTATRDTRYLVVTIDPRGIPVDLMSRLGHELRHVVEIADAREVRDVEAMRGLFRRIGWRSGGNDRWETREAVTVGQQVSRECWERPTLQRIMARAERGNTAGDDKARPR